MGINNLEQNPQNNIDNMLSQLDNKINRDEIKSFTDLKFLNIAEQSSIRSNRFEFNEKNLKILIEFKKLKPKNLKLNGFLVFLRLDKISPDLILESINKFPDISYKSIHYLNLRGFDKLDLFLDYYKNGFHGDKNGFMQEILHDPYFYRFNKFISKNKDAVLSIGNKQVKLYNNFTIIKALLDYKNNNKINNMEELLFNFENALNYKLDRQLDIEEVYLLTYEQGITRKDYVEEFKDLPLNNSTKNNYDTNKAFINLKSVIDKQYHKSDNISHIIPNNSKNFIGNLPKNLGNGKTTLIYIGLHGDKRGNAGPLIQSDFTYLNKLAKKYDNLHIIIDSCNSKNKFKNKNGVLDIADNITLTSGYQIGTNAYSQLLKKAYNKNKLGVLNGDYNNDNNVDHKEASMYAYLNYKDSFIISKL